MFTERKKCAASGEQIDFCLISKKFYRNVIISISAENNCFQIDSDDYNF